LRNHRYGQGSRRWHIDETLIKVNGKWVYLYRALDHEGNLLDVRLSETWTSLRLAHSSVPRG